MAKSSSIQVSLNPTLARFVRKRVSSGVNQSPEEVVREGLRLLERAESSRARAKKRVSEKINAGLRQADRGELIDLDSVLFELRKRAARPRRKAG